MNEEMTGTGQTEQTTTPETNEPGNTVAPDVGKPQPTEKMYPKSQIVEMMKRRVERSHKAFFNRYGVKDLSEMDKKFELAGKYDELNGQFAPLQAKNAELLRENSFLRNNVDPSRYNDIVTYFKGTGVEFSEEGLLEALKTHPEWLRPSTVPSPTTTMSKLGVGTEQHAGETEAEKRDRIFGKI